MKTICTLFLTVFVLQIANAQVTQLWSACGKNANLTTTDMTVDRSGNSYVTGYLYDTITENYLLRHFFLQKTNSQGKVQWTKYFPVPDSFSVGKAVATDQNGFIYVTGERYDTACNICTVPIPNSYLFTIKYNAAGGIVWVNRYDGPAQTNQEASELAVTHDGYVFLVGNEKRYDQAQGQTVNKMITQKINRNGTTAWLFTTLNVQGNGINYDMTNNVLVAASLITSNAYQLNKFYVLKYNSSGAPLWVRTFSENQKNGNAYFISSDSLGNVYVNGQSDTITFYNNPKILTIKYSAGGAFQWAKKEIDGTYTMPNFYGSFTTDATGNSYITGRLKVTNVNTDYLTIKRNPLGQVLWSKQYSDTLNSPSVPLAIGVDKKKNVYVTGYSYNSNSNYVYTTIAYNINGVQKWLKTYSRTPRSNNFPIGLGLDTAGNVYVAGGAGGAICTVKYGEAPPIVVSNAALPPPPPGNKFSLFPNPCKDVLILNTTFSGSRNYSYTIYDNIGRLMLTSPLPLQYSNTNVPITVKDLQAGSYILFLNDGKTTYSRKFIKQ